MKSQKAVDVLALLNETKVKTLEFFNLKDEELDTSYGVGKWTIRQILHHLTDSELIFHERLKRIIAGPKQVIWAYDQDRWNDAFGYDREPLNNRKAVYEMCRELNCQLVDKYYDLYGNKEFVHSEAGMRILKDEFERVALHNQSHIQHMQTALSS